MVHVDVNYVFKATLFVEIIICICMKQCFDPEYLNQPPPWSVIGLESISLVHVWKTKFDCCSLLGLVLNYQFGAN